MRFTKKVISSTTANIGKIQLNNIAALHALDLDIIKAMNDIIPTFYDKKAMIVSSTSPDNVSTNQTRKKMKAFCAGGDVKSVYLSGMGQNGRNPDINAKKASKHGYGDRSLITGDFFFEGNNLIHKVATQPQNTPQISLWDGIVMGGGVGITVHGKYRVATENTMLAMPETKIGYYPDVGSTFFLPRLKGGLGAFIGLTGSRLNPDDLMYAGIATHFIKSEQLDDMVKEIEGTSVEDDFDVDNILNTFSIDHPTKDESFLARNQEEIDQTFDGKEAVEDIIIALESISQQSKFATKTLNTLKQMSPTALKVTFEGMKRGKELADISECLKMEFRMSQAHTREGCDFFEGVRALLVDGDNDPKWQASRLEDVTDEIVQSHFINLGENELEFGTSLPAALQSPKARIMEKFH